MNWELATVTLPLKRSFGIARSTSTERRILLARAGGVALGEASPSSYYGQTIENTREALEHFLPQFDGDPMYLDTVISAARKVLGKNAAALCVFDLALHDWVGRKLELPLYKFFGIRPDPEKFTTFTISIAEPDVMLADVDAHKDFAMLKIKLGRNPDQDIEIMRAIRERYPRRLMVDANGGWSPADARRCIKALADLDVEYVEQPLEMGRIEETAALREESPLPIFVDEDCHTAADIPKLAGKVDGINIKLMKCGGLREARQMIAAARAFGLKLMIGCMIESSVAITAGGHISTLFDYCDLDGAILLADEPFAGMTVAPDGRMTLPERPGLGVIQTGEVPWTPLG
ncbi:MAG: dipeptide epimerase [Candidatus Sumerlaeia bacterium]